jgi:hypothetical protein
LRKIESSTEDLAINEERFADNEGVVSVRLPAIEELPETVKTAPPVKAEMFTDPFEERAPTEAVRPILASISTIIPDEKEDLPVTLIVSLTLTAP